MKHLRWVVVLILAAAFVASLWAAADVKKLTTYGYVGRSGDVSLIVDMDKDIISTTGPHYLRCRIARNLFRAFIPEGYPAVHIHKINAGMNIFQQVFVKIFRIIH